MIQRIYQTRLMVNYFSLVSNVQTKNNTCGNISFSEGEGGFASSGSCIAVQEGGLAWIGTGSNGNGRILKTDDFGSTWTSHQTPVVKGESAGITSVHFWNQTHGMITGGYRIPIIMC